MRAGQHVAVGTFQKGIMAKHNQCDFVVGADRRCVVSGLCCSSPHLKSFGGSGTLLCCMPGTFMRWDASRISYTGVFCIVL
jgi:hypothetical protein